MALYGLTIATDNSANTVIAQLKRFGSAKN
jgi:hypothetical protein